MVVMAAKWAGKCKACGLKIRPGAEMDWTKETGARHLTPEACAAAALEPEEPARVLRGAVPELPAERARARALLLAHPWKVAKSMPKLPHSYSLRRLWANDADFVWVVEYIVRVGYEKFFINRLWTYYDVDDHQYWTCGGNPRLSEADGGTGLINRALLPVKRRASTPSLF